MSSPTPKTGEDRECAFALAQAHPGAALFCGFWGAEYGRTMELIDVQLVTPDKHTLNERPRAEIEKAGIRLVIESVISNLKRQMRLEDHLAKTLPGPAQRVAQRLLARSHSDCSSTCSAAARRGRSSPMTGVEPTSAL